ncbi:MAG: flotillin-like protein FloA [Verrucomicrobiota bacterium]|nr:flotillin-like protein FloA [Verrucomicrobiota bacterium]
MPFIYILIALAVIVPMFVFFYFLGVYIRAFASGARVTLFNLVGMKLRKIPPTLVIEALIRLKKSGLDITTDEIESHYLAGGDVLSVVNALIAADKGDIPLTFKRAVAIDLAGRDVFEAVRTSVNPKVIQVPLPQQGGKMTIDAVAKDGIQLKATARITVRANLDRLVGGATQETIIARVGESIVSSIGSSLSHKAVLENPDIITKNVLKRGLDAGTAYEILSIDIADVDVGDNIGARLQADQAEADKRVAQAKAEERRAFAVANEQEMKAKTQEMKAKLVEAQSDVPLAMASALREGNLGIMDYYKMENIKSDTKMRTNIGTSSDD